MSVDTYLKGKDTSAYLRLESEGVEVLLSPVIVQNSRRVDLRSKGALLWRALDVELEHEHGPACQH